MFVVVFEDIERDLVVRGGTTLSGSTGLERLTTGLESFLDASLEADVRRIVLIDGPAVLGWESWQEIQGRYGLGAIRGLLREGAADGSVSATASEALAHLLFAACNDAALFIANADQPIKARGEAGAALRALLAGLHRARRPLTPSRRAGPRSRRSRRVAVGSWSWPQSFMSTSPRTEIFAQNHHRDLWRLIPKDGQQPRRSPRRRP